MATQTKIFIEILIHRIAAGAGKKRRKRVRDEKVGEIEEWKSGREPRDEKERGEAAPQRLTKFLAYSCNSIDAQGDRVIETGDPGVFLLPPPANIPPPHYYYFLNFHGNFPNPKTLNWDNELWTELNSGFIQSSMNWTEPEPHSEFNSVQYQFSSVHR